MDPLLSGLLIRFFERITVVLIGGMAIYLGFRLFREVPKHRDSAGNLVLPWDISIKLTRVGPGIFFALFGVAVVTSALFRPLEILPQSSGQMENKGGEGKLTYVNPLPDKRDSNADARVPLQKNLAALDHMWESLPKNLAEQDRDSFKQNIGEIKLKLLKPVWGTPEEGFGDFNIFELWVNAGEPNPPPDGMQGALALYGYKK